MKAAICCVLLILLLPFKANGEEVDFRSYNNVLIASVFATNHNYEDSKLRFDVKLTYESRLERFENKFEIRRKVFSNSEFTFEFLKGGKSEFVVFILTFP